MPSASTPLRPPERQLLTRFLNHPDRSEGTLTLAGLEGYFAAVVMSPKSVMPSTWLPGVFNDFDGTAPPNFDTAQHAQEMIGLFMRFYNEVTAAVFQQPSKYVPLRGQQDAEKCRAWCHGFTRGRTFSKAAWLDIEAAHKGILDPTTFDMNAPEGFVFGHSEDNDAWRTAIRDSLVRTHKAWHSQTAPSIPRGNDVLSSRKLRSSFTPADKAPRVNDPCPCASGKKYKKCCGAIA